MTTAVSGEINCLLPSPAGGSLRHNQEKIVCSIQAVFKVVFAPARFLESWRALFVVKVHVRTG